MGQIQQVLYKNAPTIEMPEEEKKAENQLELSL
jgi:hypothetical protein